MFRSPGLTLIMIFILAFSMADMAYGERITTTWGGDAQKVYETGFMNMLMKAPGGGVQLFNMELVENDSPGSGASEKGIWNDVIWGKQQARKVLNIEHQHSRKIIVKRLIYWVDGSSSRCTVKDQDISIAYLPDTGDNGRKHIPACGNRVRHRI